MFLGANRTGIIRRSKTLDGGGGYYNYRIVESVRVDGHVQQRTLLNLGKDFAVPEEQWPMLAKGIGQLIEQPTYKQVDLFPGRQRFSARH